MILLVQQFLLVWVLEEEEARDDVDPYDDESHLLLQTIVQETEMHVSEEYTATGVLTKGTEMADEGVDGRGSASELGLTKGNIFKLDDGVNPAMQCEHTLRCECEPVGVLMVRGPANAAANFCAVLGVNSNSRCSALVFNGVCIKSILPPIAEL